ncbi:MAG: transcriptional regulator, GntR family [Paenibacillus sp.]|jgi:DNA-binding GntR family transcriptional regulator|nr:transcriptional regulator, GntR family [Paenibacillus sp.]
MAALSLKEKAYQEIRSLILSGNLKPGEFLTERGLVERLEMSRTPIRSALEKLEAEGFIRQSPNQGIIVEQMSINKAVDIYDLRVAVEAHVVRKLSAAQLTSEQVQWFKQNLNEQKGYMEAGDFENFTLLDSQFHKMLAKVHGNNEIISMMEQLQDKQYIIAMNVLKKDAQRIVISYKDHVRIFEAIIAKNGQEAVESITRHLEYGKQILIT